MSGPWEKFGAPGVDTGPWAKFQATDESAATDKGTAQGRASGILPYIDNLVRQAANGITFGYADEIASGLDALTGRRASYKEALAENRAQDKAFGEQNPIASTAAEVTGGVAGTVAALPARLTAMGPSLIGNALKLGTTGAGIGGITGFGQGEGGFDERLGNALLPAVVGGTIGAATPFAGAAGRALMESAPGRAISDKVTQNAVAQRLANAMQRGNLDPAAVEGRLGQLGQGAMLADADTQVAKLARSARSMPGATASHADTVLDARQAQMPGILRSAFEGAEPPPSRYALAGEGQQYAQTARQVGDEAYGAMSGDKLRLSIEMQQIMQRAPAIKEAMESVQAQYAKLGQSLTPIELMDKVKQQLNRDATAAFASGQGVDKAAVGKLADEFEAAFWRANPSAQQAATVYAQAKSLPEYFDTGHKFLSGATTQTGMNTSAPAIADALIGAAPEQVGALRAGATNAVREMVGGRNAIGNTRAIARDLPSEGIAARVGEIYGPAQAGQIQRAGEAVRVFDKTDKFVRGGSQTVDKALEVVDDVSNIGVRGGSSGFTARIWENAERLANRLLGPNEAIRDAIGKATLNPNSAENRKILALAAELMRQRAQGMPIRAGLIQGAASQSGAQ